MVSSCSICDRKFNTVRGLNIHKAACERTNAINPPVIINQAVVNANTEINGHHENVNDEPNRIPLFMWGDKNDIEFTVNLNFIYEKIVYWRRNLFKLPSGKSGKDYIKECSRLIRAWSSKSALRPISLKALMIMPSLLLQKPSRVSKSKDHVESLKRRITLWEKGDIIDIFKECVTIQQRLKSSSKPESTEAISKKFSILMKAGKVNAAIKLLTSNMQGGVLPLTDETMLLL